MTLQISPLTFKESGPKPLRRHLVYSSATARQYLCVCAARDKGHALKIARQLFRLERSAYAIEESVRVTA